MSYEKTALLWGTVAFILAAFSMVVSEYINGNLGMVIYIMSVPFGIISYIFGNKNV